MCGVEAHGEALQLLACSIPHVRRWMKVALGVLLAIVVAVVVLEIDSAITTANNPRNDPCWSPPDIPADAKREPTDPCL